MSLNLIKNIEVVCPLDHPASESSPFGKAVSKRAADGGGWPQALSLSIISQRLRRVLDVKQ